MVFDTHSTIAVVGASLAGLRAAETLRAEGYDGRIVLIGAEPHQPYDRPPLSKQLLAGTWGLDRVRLRDPQKIDALGLELRLGHAAIALDVAGHRLELDDGDRLEFDGAVVSTGAHARTLPDTSHILGVHTLRTLEDCFALGAVVGPETKMAVVGAGFIGSEVAATCRGLGAQVTVIEALPVPLARVLGDRLGAACAALHTDHGVEVRAGIGVARLVPADTVDGERVTGVGLIDGSAIPADVVVIGIGVS